MPKDINFMYNEMPLPYGGMGRTTHWKRQIKKFFKMEDLKNKKILDAGCGTGTITKILNNYSNEIYACDISPKSLEIAKRYVPKAKFKIGNVLNLDYKDNSFDVVVCVGVIHHTNDAYKAFEELVRVIKPDGKMLLFVYNKIHPYYLIYNFSRYIFKNKNINDIPKIIIKVFGFFVGIFYGETISFKDSRHWFSDIFLTPIAHHYSKRTIKNWAEKNKCKITKAGYTLLYMNLITLIEKREK